MKGGKFESLRYWSFLKRNFWVKQVKLIYWSEFQEHPAELHLRIVGFEIEYKEKNLDWDLAYHQYFLKSK